MEGLMKGNVVVLPFPFSDLSANKRRPALIIARGDEGDFILCQITSKNKNTSIRLGDKDFEKGKLKITSYIKPRKIFTSDVDLLLYVVGRIKKEKMKEVEDFLCKIIKE